jgi:hypothetical protein
MRQCIKHVIWSVPALVILLVGCGGGGSNPPNNPPPNPGSTTPIPLMDMTASQNYLNFHGGLYENSTNNPPTDHDQAGTTIVSQIQPLDANGNVSANGKIVFAALGMSHAMYEFDDFMLQLPGNPQVNQMNLVAIDLAQLGKTACFWAQPTGPISASCDPPDPQPPCNLSPTNNPYDIALYCYLQPAGLTEAQVQVAWLKEADKEPAVNNLRPLCDEALPGCVNNDATDALHTERLLGDILRAAKVRYPNLKQVFISARSYGGYATIPLNPEPFAYENGFAVKWLVQAQISQTRGAGTDPAAGDLNYSNGTVPWVAWGPYFWANGLHARSDGLAWCDGQQTGPCVGDPGDFRSDDHTHPSPYGLTHKWTPMLMKFFLNSPYTPWFRP